MDPSIRRSLWAYPLAWAALFGLGLVLGTLAHVERPIAPTDLDQRVVRWVEAHRRDHPALGRSARVVTRSGNLESTVPAVAILASILIALRRWRDLSAFLTVACGGQLLAAALKEWFRRDRPDLAGRLAVARGYSFPSGHSMFAGVVVIIASVAVVKLVPPGRARLRAALIGVVAGLAISVASSRVWLGVHYLTDVLCGFSLGLAWATAALAIRYDGGPVVHRWRGRSRDPGAA